MATTTTLYNLSHQARRGLFVVLVAVIVILVIDNVTKMLAGADPPFNPAISCYLPPNETLGTIPLPAIPSLAIAEGSNPEFVVDRAFSRFPDTVHVYTIERPREKLDSVANAERTARALGFEVSSVQISGDDMTWENTLKTRSLRFNKLNQTWRMRTQYFQDVDALLPKDMLPTEQEYVQASSRLASTLGFTETSIASGSILPRLSRLGADGLFTVPAGGVGADYVTIDIHRSLLQTSPVNRTSLPEEVRELCPANPVRGKVYVSDPRRGNLRMVVSNRARDAAKDIYEIDFTDFEYNYSAVGLRRVVTPDIAWERVRMGEGSLTYLNAQNRDLFANYESVAVSSFRVNAQATELAYFEPLLWDGFVYPIYVFRGTAELTDGRQANFIFYVDALARISLGD